MIYTAPEQIPAPTNKSIFLGGSIDNGQAEDWQSLVAKILNTRGWDVYNPRREQWLSDLPQTASNPIIKQQINWELNALNQADVIIINFIKTSKAPISFLELGLYAGSDKILVCCPDGFYRKANIEIICEEYDIPLFTSMKTLLKTIL